MQNPLRLVRVCAPLVLAMFLAAPFAQAQIVSIQNPTSCGPSSQCLNGNPYGLSGILNGSTTLTIPPNGTPGWLVTNNTGSTITTITLVYSGSLASNAQMNCQANGAFAGGNWTCTVNGFPNGTNKPGSGPITITWTAAPGQGIASGATFDLNTASFAAAGQDTGTLSGPTSTPEPRALTLLLAGLVLGGVGFAFRRRLGFGAKSA